MKIKTASGLVLAWMNLMRFDGWASFWRTAYIRPGFEGDKGLVAHEMKHLEQIEREGRILFTLKYLWLGLVFGYYDNPYEIEARAAARLALSED